MAQLVQLQKDLDKIQEAGIQLVGISYDSTDVLSEFAKKRKITFPLLSDKDSQVIDAYKVRNPSAGGRQEGIPHPVTIVVNQQGKVAAKLPGTVRRRHGVRQLLDAVR